MKAVIIDDEVWSRRMIRGLGRWDALGIAIAGEAENGFEGWQLILAERPEIVLLDMRMPGMEGTELIRKLNEQAIEAKVIIISGHADFQYTKHAIDYKASTYILKPIDEEELNAALEKCVREIRLRETQRQQELQSVHYANRALSELMAVTKRELARDLHGLDAQGIAQSFRRLVAALELHGVSGDSALRKIYVELYLLLEDFLVQSGVSVEDFSARNAALTGSQFAANAKSTTDSQSHPRSPAAATPEELADSLAALYIDAAAYIKEKRRSKDKIDLGTIKAYIDRNYERSLTLESVADAFYVSKEYLSKTFKAKTGSNLTDYVIGLRMEKARGLVCASELKIKSIAQSVGYEDVTYFNRLFKSHFGETPGNMRERLMH